MSFVSQLRAVTNDSDDIVRDPRHPVVPELSVDAALALLRRGRSRAEVAYARTVLEHALTSSTPLTESQGIVRGAASVEDDKTAQAFELLRESRSPFEAATAAKVLRRLVHQRILNGSEHGSVGTGSNEVRLDSVKVLVIEDDPGYRSLLVHTLKRSGASVSEASTVDEAQTLMVRHKPDVIVSDIHLPGQSGYHLMKFVQSRNSPIPVLAISGEPQDAQKLKNSGFKLFFVKEPGVHNQIVESIAHMPEIGAPLLVRGQGTRKAK